MNTLQTKNKSLSNEEVKTINGDDDIKDRDRNMRITLRDSRPHRDQHQYVGRLQHQQP